MVRELEKAVKVDFEFKSSHEKHANVYIKNKTNTKQLFICRERKKVFPKYLKSFSA